MWRRGGVLIADSVGLGKTHIGAALITRARSRGLRCAIITPTSLQQHWRRTLRDSAVRIITHAQLSRTRGPALIADAQFVVIDEAHAFRTRHTRRYRALRALRGSAAFVLLSATPVNNSSNDLLNLLLLFARDDAFRDIGVTSLASAFHAGDSGAMTRVLSETAIRRTRAFVRYNYAAIIDARGHTLRFPDREDPIAMRYDLGDVYGDAWPGALDAVHDLELAWLDAGARELLRLNLLKRFESSVHAFVASLDHLGGFCNALLEAIGDGRTLSPSEYRRFFSGMTDQLVMRDVLLRTDDRRSIDPAAIRRDRDRIAALIAAMSTTADPKLDALRDVLRRFTSDAPAIVFATFRDTARHLWRALRNEFRTALIDGQDARLGASHASRTTILRALAPGARVHARERIDVLVATDVLSEGLDLHAARTVISYDLPWNPIRIVQRVGRLDRPGSPHATIRIVNFIPDRGLDRLLDLLHRIRTKLDTIRGTIGLEAPVLDRSDVDADALHHLLNRLAAGDTRVLDDDGSDALALNERLHHEWLRLRSGFHPLDANVVAGLPGDGLLLARGGRVFVLREGRVREDWAEAVPVLVQALEAPCVRDVDPERVECTLRRFDRGLAALEAGSATDGAAARAARLLLAAAPRLPGPSDLVRIEAVVRNLRLPLPHSAGSALERLVRDPPQAPRELLDRLETAVAEAAKPAAGPWVLLLGTGAPIG